MFPRSLSMNNNELPLVTRHSLRWGVWVLCALFTCLPGAPIVVHAQDEPLRITDEQEVTEPQIVALSHGLPRSRVLESLDSPALESRIGSLDRSRATLSDGTELLFHHDALIGLRSPQVLDSNGDGTWSLTIDRTTFVFEESLLLTAPKNLAEGEQRRAIDEDFYFQKGTQGDDGFDIHFTPSTPVCLLNDCAGCAGCLGDAYDSDSHGAPEKVWFHSDWERFRLSVNAVFISRSGGDLTLPLLAGGAAVEPEELTHGVAPGMQATLDYLTADGQNLEFGFLGAFNWASEGESTNLIAPNTGVLSWNGTYGARLNDFQVNYKFRELASKWSLSGGIRYSEHEDSYTAAFAGELAGPPAETRNPLTVSGLARNRLLGVQAGSSAEWGCGPFRLFASVHAGVYNNETQQQGPQYDGSIDLGSNPSSLASFNREGEEVSFMGDMEFAVLYPFREFSAMRLGYRGLIVSDAVQVRNQLGNAANGTTLQYHGLFVGLEVRR